MYRDSETAETATVIAVLRRNFMRMAFSIVVCGLMVRLLLGRLSEIEPAEVAQAFAALPPAAWGLSLAATAVSFWAVGHYDTAIHRHFATHLPEARTRLAGICAIAVSQMIGLGVISGAILRWRMLPELGPWRATRMTAAVAVSFLGAWAMVTAIALLVFPAAPYKGPAAFAFGLGIVLAAVSVMAPRLGHLRFRWPNLFTLSQLFSLCVIDTLAAALAFYVLCPPGLDLTFALFLPAFLLALGAGLISGSPSGMGAFEMTLLALLPTHDQPELLAAVLGWRIVYFALPAILGAGLAIRGPRHLTKASLPAHPGHIRRADRAELQILRQGEHELIGSEAKGLWVAGRTSHCLVGLFSPVLGLRKPDLALKLLSDTAKAEGRIAVIYKAAPRLAAKARSAGFVTVPIAREAVIALASYCLASAPRAGLRRKLRRAEAAGVKILGPDIAPDWDALDAIASHWALSHGTERGFSMGRYAHRYVQGQRLYVAQINHQPVAFVSFHDGPRQRVLDLMRHVPNAPDGAMHLLIQTAISDAQSDGIAELSLAAVPENAFLDAAGLAAHPLAQIGNAGGLGLARFKSAFAPSWQRRYMCVPQAGLVPLAAWELSSAIHHPGPLPTTLQMPAFDQDHEEYAFASAR